MYSLCDDALLYSDENKSTCLLPLMQCT